MIGRLFFRLTALAGLGLSIWGFLIFFVDARDDGRYAKNPLKHWFDSLRSERGFCCSEADGRETEYETRDGHYRVPVNGIWTDVPDDAVITEPNKFGRALVWLDTQDNIRCFIPGAGL